MTPQKEDRGNNAEDGQQSQPAKQKKRTKKQQATWDKYMDYRQQRLDGKTPTGRPPTRPKDAPPLPEVEGGSLSKSQPKRKGPKVDEENELHEARVSTVDPPLADLSRNAYVAVSSLALAEHGRERSLRRGQLRDAPKGTPTRASAAQLGSSGLHEGFSLGFRDDCKLWRYGPREFRRI
jgi:hypothetical protein